MGEYHWYAPSIAALQATGILRSLDEERATRLLAKMLFPHHASESLAPLVEAHLRDAPGEDVVLGGKDRAYEWSARRLEVALQSSLANTLWDDEEWGHVHLVGRGCMRPKGDRSWMAVFEAALAHLGDARRFVSLQVPIAFDDPLYLLVNDEQRRALAREHLIRGPTPRKRQLPPAIPGREQTPPSVELVVDALTALGVRAKAFGARVSIELESDGGQALLERVKANQPGGDGAPP